MSTGDTGKKVRVHVVLTPELVKLVDSMRGWLYTEEEPPRWVLLAAEPNGLSFFSRSHALAQLLTYARHAMRAEEAARRLVEAQGPAEKFFDKVMGALKDRPPEAAAAEHDEGNEDRG